MSESIIRDEKLREALFSGTMDLEGMGTLLDLYRDLFPAVRQPVPTAAVPRSPSGEAADTRLREGFTLADPTDLLPEEGALASRSAEVLRILSSHSKERKASAAGMAELVENPGRLAEMAGVYLGEGEEALRNRTESLSDVSPEVVMFVIFNALKGLFLETGRRFAGTDLATWEQGHCPVCGGEPAVSYMVGEGGKRHLVCHRCETHWRFRRLTCPFCAHEDPRESGYLFSEAPEYRTMTAQLCSRCRAYVKNWRVEGEGLGSLYPEIEDLKTPGFDGAVEQEGYRRGAPNIFGVWIGTAEGSGKGPDPQD
ncbi:MAG: formate dehydrogenase accessory protein FdhE [bacterium]|nr:MAG: formate dehydrogenase accessory protein FdhE [bacterium]